MRKSKDVFTLTYCTYARASKVFEYFASEWDAVGMGRSKNGKWFVVVAA